MMVNLKKVGNKYACDGDGLANFSFCDSGRQSEIESKRTRHRERGNDRVRASERARESARHEESRRRECVCRKNELEK